MNTGRGCRNGLASRIWLHICKEGGMWAPEEIAQQFDISRQHAALTMHNMARRGGLLHRDKLRGRARFCVKPHCVTPQGITKEQLTDLGVVRTA